LLARAKFSAIDTKYFVAFCLRFTSYSLLLQPSFRYVRQEMRESNRYKKSIVRRSGHKEIAEHEIRAQKGITAAAASCNRHFELCERARAFQLLLLLDK
jgi:hypothetical protein